MTGSVSAHLAQGHSAAGEKEIVSRNSTIGKNFNCLLLTKDWFFGGSCVTCNIHTDPKILFNPLIHCLFSEFLSCPLRDPFCPSGTRQVRLEAPGFDLGKPPPWFLHRPTHL